GGRSPARRSPAAPAARSAAGWPGSAAPAASPAPRRRAARRRDAPASTSHRSSGRVRAASASRWRNSQCHLSPWFLWDAIRPQGTARLLIEEGAMRVVAGDRAGDGLGELVDLGGSAALGNRDQEAVLVLGVLAAERVTGGDAALGAVIEHGGDRGIQAHRELAYDRRLVQQLDP